MAQLRASLTAVKEWRRKSTELYDASNDGLASLMSRGFESMVLLLSDQPTRIHVQRSLLNLDSERKNSMQFEDSNSDNLRSVMYGFVESMHSTLLHLTEKVDSLQEENETLKALLELHRKSDEMAIPNYGEDEMIFKEEEMLDDDMKFEVGDENEIVENTFNEQPSYRAMSDFGFMEEDMSAGEEISDEKEPSNVAGVIDGIAQSETSSDTVEMKKRRRSSLITYKDFSNDSLEVSDRDDGFKIKKKRVKDVKNINDKRNSSGGIFQLDSDERHFGPKNSDTFMECHLCEYRTRSAGAWYMHLKNIHSTTPSQGGVALLCECGNKSQSDDHNRKCDISNFTVVKKPLLITSPPTTKCIMCEAYPTTVISYTTHLQKHHSTTLIKSGFYLTCSCGHVFRSHHQGTHDKECDGRQFTLHKIEGGE